MKILYAIQGTGNGHVSRARDLIPAFQKQVQTDVLISGIQADVDLGIPVDHRLHGMGFIFGKKGNVDLIDTFRKCVTRQFIQEVREFPIRKYDLVINDFEPVSAWAARLRGVPCVSLSHQFAVLHPNAPKPEKSDWLGKMILANYAPVQSGFGFHFQKYGEGIFSPIIRQQVRNLEIEEEDHVTVYLPAYDNEKIVKVLSQIPGENWQVFSKHTTREFKVGNIWIKPIENQSFIRSMASSKAVLCGAGFEAPAEAMFLGKKLMVIPMKNQFEQQCNAAALAQMGVRTLKSLKKKYVDLIKEWLWYAKPIPVDFPHEVDAIADLVLQNAGLKSPSLHLNVSQRLSENLIFAKG
jgi:uncharacterized protein (TIGR00661 family)